MTRMTWKPALAATIAALFVAGPLSGTALASGGGRAEEPSTPPPSPEAAMTPEQKAAALKQRAEELYNKGYEEVEAAGADREQLSKLDPVKDEKAATKLRESSAKHYKKAIEKFQKATDLVPEYYEAWNMLGYSWRKTGQVGNAFKAYAACLKLKPDYEPAHEYLGEAHLVAGDVEKAKAELEWLKGRKSELAAQLESAIQKHMDSRAGASAGSGW